MQPPSPPTPRGLTEDEARRLLDADGPNELPEPPTDRLPKRVLIQLRDPLTLLLAAAGLVSILLLRQPVEGATILAIVVINVAVTVLQQGRADKAMQALTRLMAPMANVERDAKVERRPAAQLVVGDLLHLNAGDRVAADITWIEAHAVSCNEAIMTGESMPVPKAVGDVGLAGTLVVQGRGLAHVTATGARTQLGRLARTLGPRPEAPLQNDLRLAARRVTIAALAAGVLLVTLVVARRGDSSTFWAEALLAAVAMAVAAVPEGLLSVVTLALAVGVARMARKGAIVRDLRAIETLGAAGVLCVDKTGTLTEGRLAVTQAQAVDGAAQKLWPALRRCVDAKDGTGDALDAAIEAEAHRRGVPEPTGRRLDEIPFEPQRRAMWTLHDSGEGPLLTMKGAPETVLERCRAGPQANQLRRLAEEALLRGQRVLAVASRMTSDLDARDLDPLGIVAFSDPVRPTALAAVERSRHAGIAVVMVTGDHPSTAAAVAKDVGLDPHRVVTGAELEAMPPSERARALREASVVARVQPQTKVDLVQAHQSQDRVVAMMGDGVNDAPALRRADIGVAVAGAEGTDVAREASSIVLTQGDLGTLVTAVREGRRIFHNLVAVVSYLLAGNASEVIVVLLGTALFPGLIVILAPVQLLWINLITDGPPALALGTDDPPKDLLESPPRDRNRPLLPWSRYAGMAARGAFVAALVLATALIAADRGRSPSQIQTQVFLSLIFCHLTLAYVSREGGAWRHGWARNRILLAAVAGSMALQIVLLNVPALRTAFRLAPASAETYALAAAAAIALLAADLARNLLSASRTPKAGATATHP